MVSLNHFSWSSKLVGLVCIHQLERCIYIVESVQSHCSIACNNFAVYNTGILVVCVKPLTRDASPQKDWTDLQRCYAHYQQCICSGALLIDMHTRLICFQLQFDKVVSKKQTTKIILIYKSIQFYSYWVNLHVVCNWTFIIFFQIIVSTILIE